MKTNLILFSIAVATICSCSKDAEVTPSKPSTVVSPASNSLQTSNTTNARLPSGVYNIVKDANGEYVCSYGSITFGTNFVHPTTVDATGATDGEPINSWDFVSYQSGITTLASIQVGSKFSVIQPKIGPPPTQAELSAYRTAVSKYINDPSLPMPVLSTSSGGQVIEIKGMVIRDHTSPTNASVVSGWDYVYTPSTSTTPSPTKPLSKIPLGFLKKSGYGIFFYRGKVSSESAGDVSSVTVNNTAGTSVAVRNFSLTYTLDSAKIYYRIVGTLELSNGTAIPINDNVIEP